MINNTINWIVVASDEEWSDVWMPQVHYAYQLSKRYKVIFIDPPNKWKLKNLIHFKLSTRKVENEILIVRYLNVLPLSLGRFAIFINDKINEYLIGRLIGNSLNNKELIMWRFDPFRNMYNFDNKNKFRQIFHVIDPIAGSDLDVPLSIRAELVIITSPKFREHYDKLNSNVLQIGQGVDLEYYKVDVNENDPQFVHSKDSILLLGTFTDDIDYIFLKKLGLKFPDYKLVLIGPNRVLNSEKQIQFKELLNLNNVKWLGSMPPLLFSKHLAVCKIGIIYYDKFINKNNSLRSPLKIIGYLAAGKPVLSNIDCEVPILEDKAIYYASDENSFFKHIDDCFSGNMKFDKIIVDEFLEKVDYDYLLNEIFARLQLTLKSKK